MKRRFLFVGVVLRVDRRCLLALRGRELALTLELLGHALELALQHDRDVLTLVGGDPGGDVHLALLQALAVAVDGLQRVVDGADGALFHPRAG